MITGGDTDASPAPGSGRDDSATILLPWHYSWWRVALVAAALTLLAVGAVAIVRDRPPGAGSVDVGFLQDMRSHHDQAVLMSLMMLEKTGTDRTLDTIAAEILLSQQQETGMIVELLGSYGAAEENSSGTAMTWMHQPVPLERMPGMASEAELDALDAATGAAADVLFTRLMIAHHDGGVAMAAYAAEHAGTARVRELAGAMAAVQRSETAELRGIETRLGSPG